MGYCRPSARRTSCGASSARSRGSGGAQSKMVVTDAKPLLSLLSHFSARTSREYPLGRGGGGNHLNTRGSNSSWMDPTGSQASHSFFVVIGSREPFQSKPSAGTLKPTAT